MTAPAPALEVSDLAVTFATRGGPLPAVRRASFTLQPGECVGIVGESGSGKSQTFLAIMGLLAKNGRATGSVRLAGEEILNAPRERLDALRGDKLAIVFQDSITGLTPHMRIGAQLMETLKAHRRQSGGERRREALAIMEVMQIPNAAERFKQFPHELSGGMRQRIMIAQALLCRPQVLLADEPTTALDVTVQAAILRLLKKIKQHAGTAIAITTHDLGVAAQVCDRIVVMYAGDVVETGPLREVFARPMHPYTKALLAAAPSLRGPRAARLNAIEGSAPNLMRVGAGCSFAPRCASAQPRCSREAPSLSALGPARARACWLEAPP
jgi:oligopeptide transport system ATP-binding protein